MKTFQQLIESFGNDHESCVVQRFEDGQNSNFQEIKEKLDKLSKISQMLRRMKPTLGTAHAKF